MKTREELNAIKDELENLNTKLKELSEEELAEVIGGAADFEKTFEKTITLITGTGAGKTVISDNVRSVTPSSKTLATGFE